MAYRSLALVTAFALAAPACQTTRQALATAGICGGIAVLDGAAMYSARHDDEGPPPIFPLAFIAAGSIAVISLIDAAALAAEEHDKSK